MKHKATKQILSLLLAMVMLVGLLPTAAIPVFALDVNDIDAYESDYQYGYFLKDGTWVRLVYDWDDMDRVFRNLRSMDEYPASIAIPMKSPSSFMQKAVHRQITP